MFEHELNELNEYFLSVSHAKHRQIREIREIRVQNKIFVRSVCNKIFVLFDLFVFKKN